jgi:hypothetical protein
MKFLLVALLLFVTTTTGHANDSVAKTQDQLVRIDQFVEEGVVFAKDTTLPALRNLPGLKNESSAKEINRHDPKKITEFKRLEYNGLMIYGYVMESGKLGLIEVTITSPQWKILNGLNVGAEFKKIVQVLGTPDTVKDDLKTYCGETECVEFKTKADLISEIRFLYYAD